MVLFSEEEFMDVEKSVIHYVTSNKKSTGCHENAGQGKIKISTVFDFPSKPIDRTNCDEEVK